MRARPVALLALLALCGCASSAGYPQACLLPSQKPMVEAQLFFGRAVEGRGPVSDAEWSDFAASVVARNFPDGFTVSDGDGAWRDPKTGAVTHEQTKILIVAAAATAPLASRLADVIAAYRARFHQQSVGVITRPVCAAF